MRGFVKILILFVLVLMVVFGWIFYVLSHWPAIAWITFGALLWWFVERVNSRVRNIRRNREQR